MAKVLFVDPVCPAAYSGHTLQNCGLGGTEATVVRIADGLAQAGIAETFVAQHTRDFTTERGAAYIPFNAKLTDRVYAAVVVLREPVVALNMRKIHGESQPVYLWLHDLPQVTLVELMPELAAARIELLCVSHWQHTTLKDLALQRGVKRMPVCHVVFNPIDDGLVPDPTLQVDPYKLVFFSSPHKGLDYALQTFDLLRKFDPKFTLHISNPGYFKSVSTTLEGVVNHNVLSHAEVIKEVRSAFAVWYPNYVFPETFGLVFAEANAVGTPVLTHKLGAASEVLNGQQQMVDCRDKRVLISKLLEWQKHGRPAVSGKPEYRLTSVLSAWERLLGAV